jgi:nitrite reductase/ring-hydroxylating ferredoxin subunit
MVPVSLSGGVEPGARTGTGTGTSAGGLPVVVGRGQDGAVRAWADRCPHRGTRLSFGFVRDNALTCIYHGWSFGWPGAAPPVKATVRALPAAAAEALGVIWVGTGPPAGLREEAARRLEELDDRLTLGELDGACWLDGARPTIADLAAFAPAALSNDYGVEQDAFPALRRWSRRARGQVHLRQARRGNRGIVIMGPSEHN